MPKCALNKSQSNFTKIKFRQECFPVNLLHIFRTPFSKTTSGWLLLEKLDIFDFRGNLVEWIYKYLNNTIAFEFMNN